nr:hypothetical protein [Natronosporangium hydrolyticum]
MWRRVREFAVPPSMIETATARRTVGDWAGACAAARVDADVDLCAARQVHGRELAARLRADLRHLAPDLLRWHLPRVAPIGRLRPGLTVSLARYPSAAGGEVQLVARTAPAWAAAGQRIGLTLWDGTRRGDHLQPPPDRRFRLDLHRHLWHARHTSELPMRSGVDSWLSGLGDSTGQLPRGCAAHRWAAEAALLRCAEGRPDAPVLIRLGGRRRLILATDSDAPRALSGQPSTRLPVLPDAATWALPDLLLLRAGLISAGRLHPLVAAALAPYLAQADESGRPDPPSGWPLVECDGSTHRIGLVDGVLAPLDHDPDELRREELLVALGGTPLPCLRVIDEANRDPVQLNEIRPRLDHGDVAGALAAVEGLLGPDAVLRDGALRDELATVAAGQVTAGLYRAGLTGRGPLKFPPTTTPRERRTAARRRCRTR